MAVFSAVDERLNLWCLVFTARAGIPDLIACLEECLETPERYARIDTLIDARRATSYGLAGDEDMDRLVHLVRKLRGDGRYQTAYLTRGAEMRTNVDIFLQLTESQRARRRGFTEVSDAVLWLGRPAAAPRAALFLAQITGHGRWRCYPAQRARTD